MFNLIKNLFKPKEEYDLKPTSIMIEEDAFWSIVSNSLENTNSQDTQEAYLIKSLQKLSPEEIIGFKLRFNQLAMATYNSDMWCAAYIINGGCGDDSFDYFRYWIISRGKEAYYQSKESPDSLISFTEQGEVDDFDFESISYVAGTAFENKTGKDIYDYMESDPNQEMGGYHEIEFTWKEEDPETMKAICPQLFEKFWK